MGFWVPCFALVLSRWEWLYLYIALGDVFLCCSVCAFGLDDDVCNITMPHLSNFRLQSAGVLVPLMVLLREMHSVFMRYFLPPPKKGKNLFILPSCVCACVIESHSSFRLISYFREYSYSCCVTEWYPNFLHWAGPNNNMCDGSYTGLTYCRVLKWCTARDGWFQASTAKQMRTALPWVVTERVLVISYRRFGTTYQSHHRKICNIY